MYFQFHVVVNAVIYWNWLFHSIDIASVTGCTHFAAQRPRTIDKSTLRIIADCWNVQESGNIHFDDFHFCRSRVIGLDMAENRIFTLCRMITWVVFLRMFWNFISSLPVKRGGSLSFLVGTISNVLVMDWK